jgi:hypothetical protein
MLVAMTIFSEYDFPRDGGRKVALAPDLTFAVETIQSLKVFRRKKLNNCERILAITELRKVRSFLIKLKKTKSFIHSGNIIYLSIERWRRTGYVCSDTRVASDDALLKEAFETHPAFAPTQVDKLTEIIREVDVTVFELERRSPPVSTILRT